MESKSFKIEKNKSSLTQASMDSRIEKGEEKGNQNTKGKVWKRDEIQRMAAFFFFNSSKFQSLSSKKREKVYKRMSLFVETKNVNQCRTQTKKLFTTFKTIEKIISFYQNTMNNFKDITDNLVRKNKEIDQIFNNEIDQQQHRQSQSSKGNSSQIKEEVPPCFQSPFERSSDKQIFNVYEMDRQMISQNNFMWWQAYFNHLYYSYYYQWFNQ